MNTFLLVVLVVIVSVIGLRIILHFSAAYLKKKKHDEIRADFLGALKGASNWKIKSNNQGVEVLRAGHMVLTCTHAEMEDFIVVLVDWVDKRNKNASKKEDN